MTKRFLTYHAGPEDPKETQSADLKFTSGVEVEVPPSREWLWWRLSTRLGFSSRVEEEPITRDAFTDKMDEIQAREAQRNQIRKPPGFVN